jgi:hypothetical protein
MMTCGIETHQALWKFQETTIRFSGAARPGPCFRLYQRTYASK